MTVQPKVTTMNDTNFEAQILDYLETSLNLSRDTIDENTLLFTDSYLDSFNMIELVEWIESTFGKKFGVMDVNLTNLDSVKAIKDFVFSK